MIQISLIWLTLRSVPSSSGGLFGLGAGVCMVLLGRGGGGTVFVDTGGFFSPPAVVVFCGGVSGYRCDFGGPFCFSFIETTVFELKHKRVCTLGVLCTFCLCLVGREIFQVRN